MHYVLCTNTYDDVTELLIHGMFRNNKLEHFENGT